MSRSSHRPSDPAYHVEDCRVSLYSIIFFTKVDSYEKVLSISTNPLHYYLNVDAYDESDDASLLNLKVRGKINFPRIITSHKHLQTAIALSAF